ADRRTYSQEGPPSPGNAAYPPDIPPREAGFAGTPGRGDPLPRLRGGESSPCDLVHARAGWHLNQGHQGMSFSGLLSLLSWVPPGLVLGAALVLLLAQLFHSLLHHGRRPYVPVLLLTLAGMSAGQLWDVLGLPGLPLGQVTLLPALLFATALQPLVKPLTVRLLP